MHTYIAAETYSVNLVVDDGISGTGNCSSSINISGAPPTDGEALYNQNCGFCHGDPADPDGMGPLAFTVPGAADCSIKGAIYNPSPWGVEQMAFLKGTLSDAQLASIAN